MRNIIYFLTLIFFTACTKDFDLGTTAQPPRYVIEGRVSNMKGPYIVRVTQSSNTLNFITRDNGLYDSAVAVLNAQVTITDNTGASYTLSPYDDTTVFQSKYKASRGYYATNAFTGVVGHTYNLSVRIGNEEFHASAYMPSVTNLDSARLRNAVIAPDGTTGLTAFAFFSEPQNERNYYLMQGFLYGNYEDDHESQSPDIYTYRYYVFDDATLPAYVNGMMLRVLVPNGDRSSGLFAYNFYPNDNAQVRLCSLTKEAFDYFDASGKQFTNDGNAYQPAPATPPGNISGGALGLFYATDISAKFLKE